MKNLIDKEGFLRAGVPIERGDMIMRGHEENYPVWELAREDEIGIKVERFVKYKKYKLPLYHTVKREKIC